MKKNRTTLKDRFKKGLIPTEADFVDLIDSMINQEEDNISKIASDPLKITALGADEALLNFYRIENNESKLSWQLKQKPGGKIGLEISDTTAGRLFIENGSGNIGIGNSAPKAKLDIVQEPRVGTHPPAVKGLYVTGAFAPDADGVEFRHTNGSQGIGFGHNTIYATGSNPDQILGLKPRGAAKVVVFGGLQVNSGLQVTGTSQLTGALQVLGAPVQIDGAQRLAFTEGDISNNLKLQLWGGYGLGINSGTLFYTAGGIHSWRDSASVERMQLSTAADGGLTVRGSGTSSFAGTVCIGTNATNLGKLRVEGGAISTNGNLHAARSRLAFSDTPGDANHTIYNNNSNIDGEGGWDGMKMNVYAGLDIRVGNANGARPTSALKIDNAGNIGIGTPATAAAKLEVSGIIAFNDTSGWAVKNGFMASGSLTIGGTAKNYGGGSGWTNSTAGLLMETLDNTEIAVHDSGHRLTSLMFYEGGASSNRITIGRDMGGGWGTISNLILNGNVGVGTRTPGAKLEVAGNLKVSGAQIQLDGQQKIAFSDVDTSNNLKLQLWSGYGLGINDATLFYTAGGFHSWRDGANAERMSLALAATGGLTVRGTGVSSFAGSLGIGTSNPAAKLQVVGGAIMPAAGDGDGAGILFPLDPGGGSGDKAWMRYYSRGSESMTLEIGIANDGDDHLALMPAGGVGIGVNAPTAKLEVAGTFMERLDLVRCNNRGDWTAQDHPIMQYFRSKLSGKPVGTMMRVIQDKSDWRGHYWNGWVDADGRIRVIHNNINTGAVVG